MFCTICLVHQFQASSWGGRWQIAVFSSEGYGVFKWYKSNPFLFYETFLRSVPFVKKFLLKFSNKW